MAVCSSYQLRPYYKGAVGVIPRGTGSFNPRRFLHIVSHPRLETSYVRSKPNVHCTDYTYGTEYPTYLDTPGGYQRHEQKILEWRNEREAKDSLQYLLWVRAKFSLRIDRVIILKHTHARLHAN